MRQRWLLIETILNVLSTADAVHAGLKTLSAGPAAMVDSYATAEEPWCLLDTYRRRLERQSHLFDFGAEHGALEAAIAQARQRYMQAGGINSSFARVRFAGRRCCTRATLGYSSCVRWRDVP